MRELLPYIIAGIATGVIYGMSAIGMVLTYKTSGILNFGYGALATAAAFSFYWLHDEEGIDWKIAVILSVVVLGLAMGLAMEAMARQLALRSTAMKIIATLGIVLLVQGLVSVKFGPNTVNVPQYLPKGNETFRLAGVNITYAQVEILGVVLIVVGAFYALFRFTRVGVAMRAAVDNADLVAMRGTNPVRVRRIAWIIGSTFAALSGVLLAPLVGADAILLTFLVVQTFGAAALGYFSSIPLTFLGGLVIGVLGAISTNYVVDVSWLSGLPSTLPFIILLLVLLVLPRNKLVPLGLTEIRPRLQWRAPPRVRLVVGIVVLAGLLLIPLAAGTRLPFFTKGLTEAILLLSLGMLVRTSGQVSLGQVAFAAVGAVAFSHFRVNLGLPWMVALLLACITVVPIGALVAIPAIRLSGLFLALATLGFGLMASQLFYPLSFMFTQASVGVAVPRPSIAGGDKSYYYFVLLFVVITALVMEFIHAGRLGRLMRGMAEAPRAVSTMGLSTNMTRVIVFCISALFAAMAGALYGGTVHFATAADSFFQPFNSLVLIVIICIVPFAEPWYAIVAAVTVVIPSFFTGTNTTYWLNAIFGVSAVLVGMQGGPAPAPARLRAFVERHWGAPSEYGPERAVVGASQEARGGLTRIPER